MYKGQNIKQILYYPQTLYSVQGVKTSNKYFIIPRHYTVYKGQNIKQILYYPQTLYSVQGSKHQTNTLLSPDTIQCTRVKTSNKYFIIPRHYIVYKGQNIKQILYYPQTLYSVQGSKHQTNTLLSPDTI